MISLVLASAFASPIPSSGALEDAERHAAALLARCQSLGPACAASPEELGEAFLVSALAAAVLRGDLDARSVANGRLLAPEAVESWFDVLPAAEGVPPDAWVVAYLAPPIAQDSGPKTPNTVIRASVAYPTQGAGFEGAAVGWTTLASRMSGRICARWREQRVPSGLPSIPQPVGIREGEVALSLGPRWRGEAGADLMAYAGLGLFSSGWTGRSYRRLAEQGYLIEPAIVGMSAHTGAQGLHPLRPGGPLLAQWSADASLLYAQNLVHPLAAGRQVSEVVYGQSTPLDLRLQISPGLEWRPVEGLSLGAGPGLEYIQPIGPGFTTSGQIPNRDAVIRMAFWASVGWTL